MKYRKCEICGFRSERKDSTKRFFMARFPLDEDRCKQWVKVTGNQDLAYIPIEKLNQLKFVCGKHFNDNDFKQKGTQLKKTAVPSIGLTAEPLSDDKLVEFPCHLFKEPALNEAVDMEIIQPNEPQRLAPEIKNIEWLKENINTVLYSQQFCVLCLDKNGGFYSLDKFVLLYEGMTPVTLRNLIQSIFNLEIENIIPSNQICERCTEKLIHSYIFIDDTKKIISILDNCINDLHSKVTDIGNELYDTDFNNSNVMIVVEYDNDTYNKIDQLTTNKAAVLTDVCTQNNNNSELKKGIKKDDLKTPVIVPKLRINETEITNNIPEETVTVPNVTLKEGKLLIEPLITNVSRKYSVYSCNICQNIFTTYRSLKEHEKLKHNSIIYQCRLCEKVYNTQQYLDLHYNNAHNKTRCKFCHEVFDENLLNNHLKDRHKSLVSCCNYCNLVYYNAEQLETHIKSSHAANNNNKEGNRQCLMCLRNVTVDEFNRHRCRFFCSECNVMPCVHYNYLMSYREQVLNHSSKISCLDCDYVTKRKEHLISHVNREHLDHHPFTCEDCGTQFYTKLSLKTHIAQFHQDLRCQYCDNEYNYMKSYENHVAMCKNVTRPNQCDKCVASFDTERELNKHKSRYHSLIYYPCLLCKKDFPDSKSLAEHHARVHSGIQYKKRRRIIECTLCDITLKNLKEMTEHQQIHDDSEVYPCKECPKSFKTLKEVYIHKQNHYSQKTKCQKCNKIFSASYKTQHEAVCLKKGFKLLCNVCGKTFNSESVLKNHQKNHLQVACIHCNKKIKPSSMQRHIMLAHSKESTDNKKKSIILRCQTCGYMSKRKYDMENHINKMHLKIKPYSCKNCNKSFCGKIRLLEHIKTHSIDNVCFCPHCDKKFANKVCLKMHIRKHTGETPYECNICFQKFRTSSIMKSHRLKKHQDKNVPCPLCGTKYHLVPEMRFHVKKVHWKSDEPFDYKQIVPEEFHHLFTDRRLQKLGEDSL